MAGERDARIVTAPASWGGAALGARGEFQQRNFSLARVVAETYLRDAGIEPREAAVREAAAVDAGARAPAGRAPRIR